MLTEEIFSAAAELYGSAPDGLRTVCAAAEAELTGRLRYGLTAEDCGGIFIAAAALLALSVFATIPKGTDVEAYSAGQVRVQYATAGTRSVSAENLRRQAESMMAPYIRDGGFDFRSV